MTLGTTCHLGLGGNLGDPHALFDELERRMAADPRVHAFEMSPRYASAPVDATGPDYINAVTRLQWTDTPEALLALCMQLESDLGRVRSVRNAPRLIDVDVLLFGDQVRNSPELTVPHPRLHTRRFVLAPLLDLSPDIEIPGLGPAALWLPKTQDQVCKRI